ncbi:MAG: dihydrolipoyl dehydrogenase [Nitrococcus sp.]|nr:dihydrolipoyl dehydrogenase [Nitrococcus sp.]
MTKAQHFDVVVIGGGSGLTAAYYAVKDGKSVALITDRPDAIGGTCVNFGCIPTKTLIQSAEVMQTVRSAADFGITLDQSSVRVDFGRIMRDMRRARADNAAGARHWVEDAMTPFYSRVRFVGDKVLETEDGQCITGDKLFIAAGARAAVPPVDGIEQAGFWTNESVLELERQPASLIVIGGGYIGAELGYFFSALGTDVTVINGSPTLLAEDDDVRELFTREFGKQVKLVTGRAIRAQAHDQRKSVVVEDGDGRTTTVSAEHILLAAGRRPNSDRLALDQTGVDTDEKGAVQVDETLRTHHPDIYAYGDIIGQAMFKHTSSYEGELAYRNSQGAHDAVSYRSNPHAVFSHPQIGAVGLTEADCRDQGLDYATARVDYADVAKGKIIGSPPGFAKLIVERGTDRILGFHMIGPQASDLVHEVVVAMNTADGIAGLVRDSIHTHPSLPELVRAAFDAAA